MEKSLLTNSIKVLLFFILSISFLYLGRDFLVPIALAGTLSMLLLPLNRWIEQKGANRVISSIFCVVVVLLAIVGVCALIIWQVSALMEDMAQIKEQISRLGQQVRQFVSNNLGISPPKQDELVEKQQASDGGGPTLVASVISGLLGVLVNTILILVYIFLFLYFRTHLKKFILMLVPVAKKAETEVVIRDSSRVVQKYLAGLGLMVVILWVMYGIGFSLIGVKSAVFFAVLCGLLEIVPFVGNIAGTLVTVFASFAQGADSQLIIGIVVTYLVIQFLQTYLLQPLVVGAEVNLNPVFTILSLVAGEMVWGVGGLVLAIPLLGMLKIVCDHVEPLKPYGFLLGSESKKKSTDWMKKVKGWFK